ncbi:MAG: glycosyltransferase [Candidatus Omnitrophica bacterium]|nr:glycosyltransferase [Candidatus Omnitrophota bacterium]
MSIITPVYNNIRFVESCLRGVWEQGCPFVEHILVDGGSTDGTADMIRRYASSHSHIRWISEKDDGQSDAMNKGVRMALGAILGFLNVDDYYEKNTLNRVLEHFKRLPAPGLLVGNCNVWNDEGKLLRVNKPSTLTVDHLLMDERRDSFPCNSSAYFYHGSLHKAIGFYDARDHYSLDYDFLLRAIPAAHVVYVDEVLGNFRLVKGSKTLRNLEQGLNRGRLRSVRKRYKALLPLHRRLLIYALEVWYRSRARLNSFLSRLRGSQGNVPKDGQLR